LRERESSTWKYALTGIFVIVVIGVFVLFIVLPWITQQPTQPAGGLWTPTPTPTHTPTTTPTPTPSPTPTPIPTETPVLKEKEELTFPTSLSKTNLTLKVKLEKEKDNVTYPEKRVWNECNEYNITVTIEASFNGSDRIIIRQINASVIDSQEAIIPIVSDSKRNIELNCGLTVSPTFEFTFHPSKGIVKIEPSASFNLTITVEIEEYYEGKMRHWVFSEEIEITIYVVSSEQSLTT